MVQWWIGLTSFDRIAGTEEMLSICVMNEGDFEIYRDSTKGVSYMLYGNECKKS